MAPKFKFADGEKVLCFHGPLLYEAKCIKAQVRDKVVKYYIHYSGWNKNWDEWVPETRVLKYNDANMQKQKELLTIHGSSKKAKPVKNSSKKDLSDRESSVLPPQEKTPKQKSKEAASTPTASTTETTAELQRKKKTRAEQNVETEEEYTQKLEIKIKIVGELKHWIVVDWDFITRKKKLYKLPARVPVETILSDYVKHRLSFKFMTPNKETAVLETVNGIREYFNVMLGRQLLYNLEKAQYTEVMSSNPDSTPSQIYGAFHLLRLFTRIGEALAYTQLDEEGATLLTNNLFEFLKYMSKCSANLFSTGDYEKSEEEPPSPELPKKKNGKKDGKSEEEPASPEPPKKKLKREVKSEEDPASPEPPKKKQVKKEVKSEEDPASPEPSKKKHTKKEVKSEEDPSSPEPSKKKHLKREAKSEDE